jgi:hypothetical protein
LRGDARAGQDWGESAVGSATTAAHPVG